MSDWAVWLKEAKFDSVGITRSSVVPIIYFWSPFVDHKLSERINDYILSGRHVGFRTLRQWMLQAEEYERNLTDRSGQPEAGSGVGPVKQGVKKESK